MEMKWVPLGVTSTGGVAASAKNAGAASHFGHSQGEPGPCNKRESLDFTGFSGSRQSRSKLEFVEQVSVLIQPLITPIPRIKKGGVARERRAVEQEA